MPCEPSARVGVTAMPMPDPDSVFAAGLLRALLHTDHQQALGSCHLSALTNVGSWFELDRSRMKAHCVAHYHGMVAAYEPGAAGSAGVSVW